jgi:ribosome maturation protein SDO1
MNWRNGVEKDLDEVLQTTAVFSNVSKGILAKKEDLIQVFGTDDEEKVCMKILNEGEMQVSDKERKKELDTLFRDVAGILSEKCINPKSKKPYTIGVLERALKDIHFSADPKKPAKLQAVEALPLLKEKFPIERAQMQLRIVVPAFVSLELQKILKAKSASIVEQNIEGDLLTVECCIDPGAYREVYGFVQDEGQHGRLEVVSLSAFADTAVSNEDIEEDREMKTIEVVIKPEEALPGPPRIAPPVQQRVPVEEKVVYDKGPISTIPEEFASRRDRFSEIDELQPGWTVELKTKGTSSVIDAVFYAPSGDLVGPFARARRMALAHSKA